MGSACDLSGRMNPLFYRPGLVHTGPPLNTAESPSKARYRKPTNYLESPDAIVIGSGIGGLGIASLLAQKRGMRVLLLEANVVPGGCTHCHEIDGFEFPSGLDSVGDMDPRIGRGTHDWLASLKPGPTVPREHRHG